MKDNLEKAIQILKYIEATEEQIAGTERFIDREDLKPRTKAYPFTTAKDCYIEIEQRKKLIIDSKQQYNKLLNNSMFKID